MAGLTSAIPGIMWLSSHKDVLFVLSGLLMTLSSLLWWQQRSAPCPVEPIKAEYLVSRVFYEYSEAAKNLPWYRGVTCKDLKDIMPTFLILVGGILILIFVIPYAFTSVLDQLHKVGEMERIQELNKEVKSLRNDVST